MNIRLAARGFFYFNQLTLPVSKFKSSIAESLRHDIEKANLPIESIMATSNHFCFRFFEYPSLINHVVLHRSVADILYILDNQNAYFTRDDCLRLKKQAEKNLQHGADIIQWIDTQLLKRFTHWDRMIALPSLPIQHIALSLSNAPFDPSSDSVLHQLLVQHRPLADVIYFIKLISSKKQMLANYVQLLQHALQNTVASADVVGYLIDQGLFAALAPSQKHNYTLIGKELNFLVESSSIPLSLIETYLAKANFDLNNPLVITHVLEPMIKHRELTQLCHLIYRKSFHMTKATCARFIQVAEDTFATDARSYFINVQQALAKIATKIQDPMVAFDTIYTEMREIAFTVLTHEDIVAATISTRTANDVEKLLKFNYMDLHPARNAAFGHALSNVSHGNEIIPVLIRAGIVGNNNIDLDTMAILEKLIACDFITYDTISLVLQCFRLTTDIVDTLILYILVNRPLAFIKKFLARDDVHLTIAFCRMLHAFANEHPNKHQHNIVDFIDKIYKQLRKISILVDNPDVSSQQIRDTVDRVRMLNLTKDPIILEGIARCRDETLLEYFLEKGKYKLSIRGVTADLFYHATLNVLHGDAIIAFMFQKDLINSGVKLIEAATDLCANQVRQLLRADFIPTPTIERYILMKQERLTKEYSFVETAARYHIVDSVIYLIDTVQIDISADERSENLLHAAALNRNGRAIVEYFLAADLLPEFKDKTLRAHAEVILGRMPTDLHPSTLFATNKHNQSVFYFTGLANQSHIAIQLLDQRDYFDDEKIVVLRAFTAGLAVRNRELQLNVVVDPELLAMTAIRPLELPQSLFPR